MDTEKKGTKKGLKAALSLIGVLVVIAAVVLAVIAGQYGLDGIGRALTYRNLGSAEQADTFDFDGRRSNTFGILGDGLLVASNQGYEYYGKNGKISDSMNVKMTMPAIYSADDYVVVFDIGGKDFSVLDSNGCKYSVETEFEIIAAKTNASGWTAVCTTADTAKGIVTVYNAEGTPVYKIITVKSGYLVNAVVSPNSDSVFVITYTDTGSRVVRYDFTSEDEKASFSEDGILYTDIEFASSTSVVLASSASIVWLDTSGEVIGKYECQDTYMGSYHIGQSTLIYESEYKSAKAGKFLILNPDGTAAREYASTGTVEQVSYSGGYVGVLYSDRIAVLDNTLKLCSESEDTDNAGGILIRKDGTMLLISTFQASLYIP